MPAIRPIPQTTIELHGGPLDGLCVSVGPGSLGNEKAMPFVILDNTVYERIPTRQEPDGVYLWVDPAVVPGVSPDWPLRKLRLLDATRQDWRWLRRPRGWRHS